MKRFFYSLRFRIILLILLAVLPALGLILYTANEEHKLATQQAKADALTIARLISHDEERIIAESRQFLAVTAQLPIFLSGGSAEHTAFLQDLLGKTPHYSSISIVKPDGSLLSSSPPVNESIDLADRPYLQRTLLTGEFRVGDYQISRLTGSASLPFSYPIIDDVGRIQAVLVAEFDLAWLNQMAAEAKLPEGSVLTIRDRNGTILARYPEPEKWVGKSVPDAPIAQAITSHPNKSTMESLGVDGISRLYAFQQFADYAGDRDVFISVGIPPEVAFADVNWIQTRNLVGVGLVTFLVVLIAWSGSYRLILRRINELMSATKSLAAGDLSVRTNLPYGQGELGQLSRAFDSMAAKLEQRTKELQEAESRYRALVENIPAVTYTLKPGEEGYVSPQINKMLGLSQAEWMSDPGLCFNQVHPLDRPRVRVEVCERIEKLESYRSEYRMIISSGFQVWVRNEAAAIRDESGQPSFIQGFVTDITDRKQNEEAVKLAYLKLNQIFNTAVDGMCVINKEFKIIKANDAYCTLAGIAKEAAIGAKCYEVFPSPICCTSDCPLNQILNGKTHVEYDMEKVLDNGSLLACIVTANAYHDLNGELIGVVEDIKDISERKQVEREMARLEQLNMVGEMAAGIGHEIRNPMTTVRGFLQMLGGKKELIEYKAHFDLMIEELDRANSIITEFLSLAKDKPSDLKTQNLNKVVKALFPLMESDSINSEKYITLELNEEIPDLLLDEKEIRQVILNLVRNGLEAMSPGGNLTVKTFTANNEVVLAVQDQGTCIESEVLEKLGQPFLTTKENGTGLGLSLCYSIVNRHNAVMEVETSREGTTMYVKFNSCFPPGQD